LAFAGRDVGNMAADEPINQKGKGRAGGSIRDGADRVRRANANGRSCPTESEVRQVPQWRRSTDKENF
jgi:hypothetical protein